MGGKRAGARSTSGEAIHPRISSAGSTKSSPLIESTCFPKNTNGEAEDDSKREKTSPDAPRKTSFDIISLLDHPQDGEDCVVSSENDKFRLKRSPDCTELPSFWHFVEPTKEGRDFGYPNQHHHRRHKHHIEDTRLQFQQDNHFESQDQVATSGEKLFSAEEALEPIKVTNPKRASKRRKGKKVQSAKVGGFQKLSRSQRGGKQGQEWLRVLTPPGTGLSSVDSENIDSEEDELIRRYFSGLSSAGSSISWAEDAMESDFTVQLKKLWEDIQSVCRGAPKPEKMTNVVYSECVQWRKAFPNPDLHRFSSFQTDGNLSSVGSPTPEDGEDPAVFTSLSQSLSPRSEKRKASEEEMSIMQTNFRALNCSTPRPNIEKATEYVSAWLTECQNSDVPEEENGPLHDFRSRNSPTAHLRETPPQMEDNEILDFNNGCRGTRALKEFGGRSTFPASSRGCSKFVKEQDSSNTCQPTSTANNELYSSYDSKMNGAFAGGIGGNGDMYHLSFGLSRFGNNTTSVFQSSRIDESDEENESGSITPSEIVSFRTAVRVQRPISSRVRDHTITPLATKAVLSSAFGGRHQTANPIKSTATPTAFLSDNYRYNRGRSRLFESCNGSSFPVSAKRDDGTDSNRVKSGLMRQGHSLSSQFSRAKQQPWSRHSGEDISADANYVSSLYENYPNGLSGCGGGSSMYPRSREDERAQDGGNNIDTMPPGPSYYSSPTSSNQSFMYFDHSKGLDCPRSLTECEDQAHKPTVSWLMNR